MKSLSLTATLVALALCSVAGAAEYNWAGQSNMINRSTGLEMNVGTYSPASYGYVSGMGGSDCGGCGSCNSCCELRPRHAFRLWSGHCAPKACSPAPCCEDTCCEPRCRPLHHGFRWLHKLRKCCEPLCCPPPVMHHYRPVFNGCGCGCNPCQCRPAYGLFHGWKPRLFGSMHHGCGCGCDNYPNCGCSDGIHHESMYGGGETWSQGEVTEQQPTPVTPSDDHETLPSGDSSDEPKELPSDAGEPMELDMPMELDESATPKATDDEVAPMPEEANGTSALRDFRSFLGF